MHDPLTVAFEIRRPWRDQPDQFWRKGYRPSWVTVWHRDPERRGDDDSCDWSGRSLRDPKIIKAADDLAKDTELLQRLSAMLATRVMFDPRYPSLKEMRPADALAASLMVISALAWRAHSRRPDALTYRVAVELALNPFDNINGVAEPERYIRCVARGYQRALRPWYRHPRWHVWHWRVQIHPWQQFRRWMLTRCAHCGGGFRYGESPVSHSWGHERTRWFRGERGLYHSGCSDAVIRPAQGGEARRAETSLGGSVADEHPVAEGDAP